MTTCHINFLPLTSFLNNEALTTNPSQTIQFNFSSTDNGESESANNYSSSSPSPCDDPNYSFNYPLEIPKYAIGYMRIPLRKNPWPCHINSRLSKPNTSNEEKQADVLNKFSIYPNPANDILHINTSTSLVNESYAIINTLGQTVLIGKLENERSTIDVQTLQAGVYFLQINFNGAAVTDKFLISK